MEYTRLAPAIFAHLRDERLQTLEADHYRLALLAKEATDSAETTDLTSRQTEIERRISVHAGE